MSIPLIIFDATFKSDYLKMILSKDLLSIVMHHCEVDIEIERGRVMENRMSSITEVGQAMRHSMPRGARVQCQWGTEWGSTTYCYNNCMWATKRRLRHLNFVKFLFTIKLDFTNFRI